MEVLVPELGGVRAQHQVSHPNPLSSRSLLLAHVLCIVDILGNSTADLHLYLVGVGRLAPRQRDDNCLHDLASHLYLQIGRLEEQEMHHNLLPTLCILYCRDKYLVS